MMEMSRFIPSQRRRFAALVALTLAAGLVFLTVSLSGRGEAAFPGGNGRIAYAYGTTYTEESIWTANPDGGSATRLTSGNTDYSPSYSADGSRIAFTRGNNVNAMNADGSGQTQLAGGSNSNSSETEWEENYEVPDSTEEIPFVKIQTYKSSWHSYGSPAFSPDGSQIAVAESHGTEISKSICAVTALNEPECLGYEDPESYFNYEYECESCASRIVTLSSSTGAQMGEVTSYDSGHEDYDPTYSVTGALAFSRWDNSSGHSQVLVVNAPGSSPITVASGPGDFAPNFSPDGSRIVFVHGNDELGIVPAAGGSLSILTFPHPSGTSGGYVGSPAFSPDGSKIVFQRFVYGSAGKANSGIFTVNPDGSGMTRIVEGGLEPSWQPLKVPPPPPPLPLPAQSKAKKSAKLNKKKQAVIGTITCGSSPCTLKALSGLLKVGKPKATKSAISSKKKTGAKPYRVKIGVPKHLAPGKTAQVTVTVKGKALAALKKAHSGKLTAKVGVAEALSKKTVVFNTTLKALKEKHKKKH